jgi:glycosyltransferase involved in cell wall biosynthesis
MTQVCFLAGQLGRGGAERQLLYMVDSLKETGIRTRVLCLTQGEPMQAELEAMGAPVVWAGRSDSRLARTREIVAALRDDPPDIVQSAHFFTNMYAAMAAAAIGRPSIGAVRSDVANEMKRAGAFGRTQVFMPRYLIANSNLGRDRIIEAGRAPERVFLVRNAVDMKRFQASDHPARIDEREPLRLLFVGNMYPAKRPDRFLRLLDGLRRQSPAIDVEARIVGSGPDLSRMRELAGRLGLDPHTVVFEDESPDTSQFYRWAHVLVLTSDHEGTPNVILEAMAAGVPVVATAVGGVPDLLAHGGGLLARPDDEDRLLRAVLRVRADRPLRDSLVRDGLRFVRANHSLEGLAKQLLSVYATVARRYRREPTR